MSETSGSHDTRLLATFIDLVRIDSPSKEEAACAAYCASELEAAGCSVRFDDAARSTGSDTGNLIAELPGSAEGTLVLSAHMDTVEPGRGVEPLVVDGVVVSAGDTVLGADDKAGLAAAIECVRRVAEAGMPHPTIRCIFTVQEEIGLLGAKALDPAAVSGDVCLVLDADGTCGGIVVAAPTHYTFKATFVGRAAHAGVEPEKGISAVALAADAIAAMTIGRVDEVTTANVGSISGGAATNVITPRVEITGECRSLDRSRVEGLRESMTAAMRRAAKAGGGDVDVAWQLEYEGFQLEEDASVVKLVARACERVGLVPRTLKTGGGSDANIISALGVPTLALSCGMQGVHGTAEQIAVSDLQDLARLCVAVAHGMAGVEYDAQPRPAL